ncbi:LMBR1 domain-containing protein 2 [Nymphon striatum]|nr:LMBR1 domain-containing protein 2 [Nymphon striatum]
MFQTTYRQCLVDHQHSQQPIPTPSYVPFANITNDNTTINSSSTIPVNYTNANHKIGKYSDHDNMKRSIFMFRIVSLTKHNVCYDIPLHFIFVVGVECQVPWSHVPDDVLPSLWKVVYWTSQALTWLILPLMQSYSTAGDFTVSGKLKTALIENAIYYGSYLFIVGLLLIYVAARPDLALDGSKLKIICITASNTWGLFLLVLLLGYGLVEKSEAEEALEDVLDDIQRSADSIQEGYPLRPYIEVILSKCPISWRNSQANRRPIYREDERTMTETPTEKSLVRLHKQLIQTMQTHHRTQTQWNALAEKAFRMEDVEKNEGSKDRHFKTTFKTNTNNCWNSFYTPIIGKLLCRLTPPLCLNYLGLVHLDSHITKDNHIVETSYTQIMGHMDVISIVSDGFNIYFPIAIVLLSIATYFSLGNRLLHMIGFQQFIGDDDMTIDLINEGRELINRDMDWNLCVICQERGGDLRCPTDSLQKNGLEVYTNFLETVDKFSELGILPVDVDFKEVAIAETFLENHAKWHKSCHIKFARSKLQRAQKQIEVKQKREEELRGPPPPVDDTALLARISGGDLVAIEAKYHYDCLSLYKNRHRSAQRASHSYTATNESRLQEASAFAELVSYIECSVENGNYIFKLSELHGLYVSRLHNLGVDKTIHKTRLKIQLLGHFLDGCQEQSDGKNILLVFNEGLKKILKLAVDSRIFEAEAISMVKLVKAVREEIFDWKLSQFTGSFKHNCQEESVPTSLKSLISMLLNGPNVTGQDETETQACLTISQLIHFNAKNKAPVAKKSRHSKKREPPLPLYVGLNVHTLTRSKNLVNNLCMLGISVSYDRIIELENLLSDVVCKRFGEEGLVCPSQLRKGLFTVGALDNIDYNPSSTTAKDSFHGTGISIFQFPTATNPGKCSYPIVVQSKVSSTEYSLPESYTTVPAVDCKISHLTVPEATITEIEGNLEGAKTEKVGWTQRAIELLTKEQLEKEDEINWAAFHASKQPQPIDPAALTSLLPLFYEKAATLAMVKHGMDIQRQITTYLNPGQTVPGSL